MNPAKITPKIILAYFESQLSIRYPKSEIHAIYHLVMNHITGMNRAEISLNRYQSITLDVIRQIDKVLVQLSRGKPVQYIIGTVQFLDMELLVTPDVLIPRPETEELAALIIREYLPGVNPKGRVLDVGTGSGCLALAIKKARPDLQVTAMDISEKALEVAHQNSNKLKIDITCLKADFLNLAEVGDIGCFDLIVSNPPYIPSGQQKTMAEHVTLYEPGIALFVPDYDPLLFYNSFKPFISKYLAPKGSLFLEVHEAYADAVVALFDEIKGTSVAQKADFRGKPRFVVITT